MPTCLFVNNSPRPGRGDLAKLGGGGTSLIATLKVLPNLGWKPYAIVPGEGQFTSIIRDLRVSHRVYPFVGVDRKRPIATLQDFRSWRQIMLQTRPAIIHGNSFEVSRSFGVAAYSLGIPFVTHVRFPVDQAGIRWVLSGLPKPKAFIFTSEAVKARLWTSIAHFAPRSHAYVLYDCVGDQFSPHPWPKAPPYRIGIVANFARFKRHEDFLQVAALISRERHDVEFWIIGDDTESADRGSELRQIATDLSVDGIVRFLGHRLDVAEILAQLHILVITSEYETFGRVAIEAMAVGRPVVASRTGGLIEIIDDGKTGYLVQVGDHQEFAKAIIQLLDDKQLRENMSANAIHAARQRFSNGEHAQQLVGIYREVLRTDEKANLRTKA